MYTVYIKQYTLLAYQHSQLQEEIECLTNSQNFSPGVGDYPE